MNQKNKKKLNVIDFILLVAVARRGGGFGYKYFSRDKGYVSVNDATITSVAHSGREGIYLCRGFGGRTFFTSERPVYRKVVAWRKSPRSRSWKKPTAPRTLPKCPKVRRFQSRSKRRENQKRGLLRGRLAQYGGRHQHDDQIHTLECDAQVYDAREKK